MMKNVLVAMLLFGGLTAYSQQIDLVTLEELNSLIESKSERLKVVNFWASWCGPCIREMPHFDEVSRSKAFDLYFVSLDFSSQKDKALRMLNKNNIQSTTLLLNEKDADKYIASINEDWSGAIPATLFIQPSGAKTFYEKALDKEELENIVNKLTSK